MADGVNPRTGKITFPCGAIYECDYDRMESKVRKNGRIRLMVLDTQTPEKPRQPKHEGGEPAACLICETRKHRRAIELMRDDGADPFAFRVGVMCSGVLAKALP